MMEAFFPDEPDEDYTGEWEDPPRDPRREPPRDEIGTQIVVGELVASSDRVAVLLSSVIVYSDGALFLVERYLRRIGASDDEWHRLYEDFGAHFVGAPGRGRSRWGVVLGNGERAICDGRFFHDPEQPAEGYYFGQHGGGGSGGTQWAAQTDRLWLYPLPPDGPLEVVFQWSAMEIPESRIVLDGGAIAEAAGKARPLWPSPGQ